MMFIEVHTVCLFVKRFKNIKAIKNKCEEIVQSNVCADNVILLHKRFSRTMSWRLSRTSTLELLHPFYLPSSVESF